MSVAIGFPLPMGHAGDPPSSLKPRAARVRLVHEHVRATACTPIGTGDDARCKVRIEPARGGTRITFSPVDSARGIIRDDDRAPVTVVLTDEPGPTEARVSLSPGAWTTAWSEPSARFFVGPGEEIALRMKTTTGRCERVDAECVLRPNQRTRALEVPEANRR
jgi:hypothetical protein